MTQFKLDKNRKEINIGDKVIYDCRTGPFREVHNGVFNKSKKFDCFCLEHIETGETLVNFFDSSDYKYCEVIK